MLHQTLGCSNQSTSGFFVAGMIQKRPSSELRELRSFVFVPPGKVTWNGKMEVWKMIFLFNWMILGSMLNFRGVWFFHSPLKLADATPQTMRWFFLAKPLARFPVMILSGIEIDRNLFGILTVSKEPAFWIIDQGWSLNFQVDARPILHW